MIKKKAKKQQKSSLWITITASIAVIAAVGGFVYYDKHKTLDETYAHKIAVSIDGPTFSSLDELKKASPYIFIGTVGGHKTITNSLTGTEDGPAPGQEPPHTEFTVNIEHVYKGKIKDNEVPFSQLGGVADDTLFRVEGYPVLKKGNTYLFFAQEYKGVYGAAAGGYAVFEMVDNNHFKINKNSGIEIDEPISLSKL